jgi:hypothetical protein
LDLIQEFDMVIFIDQSGRIRIYNDSWVTYNIRLSQTLQDIFDLPELIGVADSDIDDRVTGRTSIVDRFDQLHKIQIESRGLNQQQEIIDTDRSLPIITDFLVPNNFSIGYVETLQTDTASTHDIDISYTVRQSITYTADSERRYVMLRGQTPVQNVTIRCVAIYKDNSRNEIILPPRSIFECKLAFFKR